MHHLLVVLSSLDVVNRSGAKSTFGGSHCSHLLDSVLAKSDVPTLDTAWSAYADHGSIGWSTIVDIERLSLIFGCLDDEICLSVRANI